MNTQPWGETSNTKVKHSISEHITIRSWLKRSDEEPCCETFSEIFLCFTDESVMKYYAEKLNVVYGKTKILESYLVWKIWDSIF